MKTKGKGLIFIVCLSALFLSLAFALGERKNENEIQALVFEDSELIKGKGEEYNIDYCKKAPYAFSMLSADLSGVYIIKMSDVGYTVQGKDNCIEGENLSDLIREIEEDGAQLVFSDVFSDEILSIGKSVTISGNLKMSSASLNLSGEKILLRDFNFTGENASLKIKSGVTYASSGCISVDGTSAVILDFTAGARFVAEGMDILAASTSSAVECKMGSVEIYGGKIVNSYGAAIENSGTLTVAASPEIRGLNFDVMTDKPISLSNEGQILSSNIKVMYKKEFNKGSFSIAFLNASEASLSYVSLFDGAGAECELQYFEECKYTEEKNVLAVYLPHTLRFYSGSSVYAVSYFLDGEIINAPEDIKKEGYTFSGWYRNTELTEPYSFGNLESSDFSLYASFALTAPTFSISSEEFSYDGKKRFLSFDYLYHPLSEEGQFSFVWYKNSSPLQTSASSVQITDVSDSGSYFCKLTFSYRGDFVSVTTPQIEVTVHKKTVQKPLLMPKVYTGMPIYPDIVPNQLFTFVSRPVTDAGSYIFEFKLTDFENCRWEGYDGDTAFVDFEVLRAENEFISPPSCEDVYSGEAPRVKFVLKFGEGIVEYSADGAVFSTNLPTRAGEYYLRVIEDGTENYTEIASSSIKFTVFEQVCTGVKIDKIPNKTEYIAFETVDLTGAEFTATYNSGKSERIDIEKLSVEYKNGSCLYVTDNAVTVIFEGCSVPVPVTVKQAQYDISGVVFEDKEVVYNGKRHTLEAVSDIIGKDGIKLEIKITGGGINVGTYPVTLEFISESVNYKLPDKITKALTVKPLSLPVVYANTEFVYDGKAHIPTAVIIGVEGAPLTVTLSGAGVDAGVYVANASLSDGNYTLTNTSVEFKILKADFDLSYVNWNVEDFVYNGEAHSVSISGLPIGITLIGYANASFTEAGSYTAEAAISYDERNYNSPGKLTHEWQIKRADYDLSKLKLSDAEFIFDGNYHYPELSGELPTGYDGSSPTYSFSEGAKHVSEGRKAVTLTFATASKNYNTPSTVTLYVRILPREVEVEWSNLSFVYDGSYHLPKASSSECEIKVLGAAVDAGSYKATAEPVSSDYVIKNNEISFAVQKAENVWTEGFSVSDVYDGEAPSVSAAALSGEASYKFYKDAGLTEAAELPLAVGKYYAVAEVEEGRNYKKLISDVLCFSVLEILPTELKIELGEPLFAMKKLSDFKITAYFINNNGSQTPISKEELTVIYQNGEELRASDTAVYVSFGEFYSELAVSVSKSIVEVPSITPVVYNGETRLPRALISPLFRADFEGARNAGEYKILFTLTDPENYEFKDGISESVFVIKKAPITLEVKKNGSDFKLVKGEIFPSDELFAEYYESDGKIYLKISNPNYDLTVIPREDRNASIYVLLLFLIAIVILLATLGLYIVFSRIEKRTATVIAPLENKNENTTNATEENITQEINLTSEEAPLKTLLAVDESYANNLISDMVAKSLISEEDLVVETDGKKRCILNLDTISENFSAGETVNINDFKKKGLIPSDAKHVKILARGVIDKPINILANSFSLSAVKMIALTGGVARRVRTVRRKSL